MNAQCYRVIFNKARGMLMVVSESTRAQGKASNPASAGSSVSQTIATAQADGSSYALCYQGGRLRTLRAHVLLTLGLATMVGSSAYAADTAVIADAQAAANQQATILKTANGKTQVNIQTPSAKGVSRNVFTQFDVGADGAILNNSRKNTQTQLAGWVEGNPYLARGEAKVILNEVNSSNPSQLAGYTEIAGGRAELVIANPAGITCSGCGFINASRTTLSTGTPMMEQGQLTGFDVNGGKIRIDGDGLDDSRSDYTQLISKAMELNAGIYANDLDVITGSNTVSYDDAGTPTKVRSKGTDTKQETGVAFDVSALGAMYAGKIRLVGTDKGMGVTNAGSIMARSDNLQLDINGNLTNTGDLIANQNNITINTKEARISNAGTIASSRGTTALNAKALSNTGVISSHDTLTSKTQTLDNSGEIAAGSFDVNAKAVNNTGKLLQTGLGDLSIRTQHLHNHSGAVLGQDLYGTSGQPADDAAPTTKPPSTAKGGSQVQNDDNTQTTPEQPPAPIITNTGVMDTESFDNTGVIYTNGNIDLSTQTLSNEGKSSLAANTVNISKNGNLNNTDSRIQLDHANWQLSDFSNQNGSIQTVNNININAKQTLNNHQGTLAAGGLIDLNAEDHIDNRAGKIQANGTVDIDSAALNNTEGLIGSAKDIRIQNTDNLDNTRGRVQTSGKLAIQATGYDNTNGALIGAQQATVRVTDDITINSDNSNIQSNNLTLSTQGHFTNTDTLSAQNTLNINANAIDNKKGAKLISGGTTQLNADNSLNNSGLINGTKTYLHAKDSVINAGAGRIYGDHIGIATDTLNNTPDGSITAPIIAARQRLDIGVNTLNNNPNPLRAGKFNTDFESQAKILSNDTLHIGGNLDSNHHATGQAKTVTNKGASIESVGDMHITADTINNVNANFDKATVLVSEEDVTKWRFKNDDQNRFFDEEELRPDSWDYFVKETDEKLGEDYYDYNYTERVHRDKVTASDPARILSGGNLYLTGDDLTNDKSSMVVGDGNEIIGDTFVNINETGQEVLTKEGYYQLSEVEYHGWGSKKSRSHTGSKIDYVSAPEVRDIYELPILNQAIDKTIVAFDVADPTATETTAPTEEIRSSSTAPTLPSSSLYGINPDSDANYLIETDPAFADYKNWLSSDYMLERLKLDPNITHKRLGDGYYEQQYIRDQIMMLTGHYYLDDYSNQDTQYKALMNAGITVANELQLRPGIALSKAQAAQLTTDIVWLVQQEITLADGSRQNVLVPRVYTRQAVGQIDGTGNLIAARNMGIQLTGSLNNQGNIIADQGLTIDAQSLTNRDVGLIKGSYVQVDIQGDVNNLGATLQADNAMQLNIGGNLNNQSQTYSTSAVQGASNASRTDIRRISRIDVGNGLQNNTNADASAPTTFAANVAGDTVFEGARLNNQSGRSVINTQGDVKLNATRTRLETNSIGDSNNYYKQNNAQDIGSQLNSNNDLIITGNSIKGTAVQLDSTRGTTALLADNDIALSEGRQQASIGTAYKSVDKGTFSTTTTQGRYQAQSDTAISNRIEGNNVLMQAGRDIDLTSSDVITDSGVQLQAGRDITIQAAQNTASSEQSYSQRKSGLFGTDGGLGFTIGKQQSNDTTDRAQTTYTESKVGAIDGNVIIDAGRRYEQTGSHLVAGMGEDSSNSAANANRGNVVVRAQDIDINNVIETSHQQNEQRFKQSGLTVSVSNSLIDNAKAIDSLIDAGGNTQSTRMKTMAGVTAALKAQALAEQATKGAKGLASGINAQSLQGMGNTRIQATIGSQKNQSNSSSYSEQNKGSTINANTLALIATGAGTDSNIDINGSNLTVTGDALLQADNDVNLSGVAQNSRTRSTNSSSSNAIGAYAATGGGQGANYGITASASRAKGYANSDATTYDNSHLNIGGTTTLYVGNDLNLKGGIINTNRVQGKIGGDVNIESLQDTATYDSKQKNMGFSADIDLYKGTSSSLSVNGGKTNLNANYQAVGEQSGIFTGDGGFDIAADGKTTLIGGAITTTEAARDAGRNNYESLGGIETQDINNTTSYDGDAIQVGVSVGNTDNKPQASMNGLGYGADSDNDSSVTRAGITGIAGSQDITTDNRAEYAGILENSFDAGRVNEELEAQTQITQEFGKEAPKAVAEFSGNIQTQLILDGDLEEAEKWAEGGAYRVALHTLVGAIATGSVDGALASGTTAVSIPAVDAYLEKQGVDETTRDVLLLGLSAAAGAVVGGDTASTATSFSQTQNNFLSHKERDKLEKLLEKARKNKGKLSVNDSEALTNLIGKDQLTDALLYEFIDGKKLQPKELDALALALNQLVANGGKDAKLAESLMTMSNSGSNLRTLNYLDPRAIKRQVEKDKKALSAWEKLNYRRKESPEEKIYNQAKTTLTINQQQTEIARYGGDAVYGAPGKTFNVIRSLIGAATVASGVKNISEGNKDIGRFEVVGGALLFVPINGKPVPASKYSTSITQSGQKIIPEVRYNNPQVYREQLAKKANIPKHIDFQNDVKTLAKLDSQELRTYFEINGYNTSKPASRGSGNAEVYNISNHETVKAVQYSPANPKSTHRGEYRKITYKDGQIFKFIDTSNHYLPDNKLSKNTTYFNQEGQRIMYNFDKKKWSIQ